MFISFPVDLLISFNFHSTYTSFPVLKIIDKIFVTTTLSFLMIINVYSQPFRALPIGFDQYGVQLPGPIWAQPQTPIGVLGVGGNPAIGEPVAVGPSVQVVPPIYNPKVIHDSNSLQLMLGVDQLLLGPMIEMDTVGWEQSITDAGLVIGLQVGNPYYGPGGGKRSFVATSCSQIMIRGIDFTKLSGTIFW